MEGNRSSGVVTNSTGQIDRNGDIVGVLIDALAETRGPLEGRYHERDGLDARITEAGADVASVRRMLRVGR